MGKRFSLVVGINDYGEHSTLEPLRFAEADATLMAESLRNDCGFEVEVLLGDKASLESITRTLRTRYDTPLDLFLFFFAGHGEFLAEVGMHCLHCYGSEAGDTIGTLNLSEWASRIRHNITADSSVMIIDACRSKVYRGSQARGAASGLDSSVYTALKGVADTRDIRVAPATGAGRQRARPMYSLLACSAGQVSYEDAQLGHGVFTHSLVDEIRANGGELSLGQLRRRVGDRTYEWCLARHFSPEQVPEWVEPSLSGEVWLREKESPKPPVVPLKTAASVVDIPSTIPVAAAATAAPVEQLPDVLLPAVEPATNRTDITISDKIETAIASGPQTLPGKPQVLRGRLLAALVMGAASLVLSVVASVPLIQFARFLQMDYHSTSAELQGVFLFVTPLIPAIFFAVVALQFSTRSWLSSFLVAFVQAMLFGLFASFLVITFGSVLSVPSLLISLSGRSAVAFWVLNKHVVGFRAADAGVLPLWCYFFDDARLLAAKDRQYRPSVGRQK